MSTKPKLKSGSLSISDQTYIRENASKMPLAKIAEALGRRTNPIIKFIKENGLTSFDDLGDIDEEYQAILEDLQSNIFYKELKKQLDEDELKYFSAHWIEWIIQFNCDVLASEQMQIKELIIIDILNNRIMSKRLMAIKDIKRINEAIEAEYTKPMPANPPIVLPAERDIGLIMSLETQLGMAKAADSNLTTESTKLSKDKKDLYIALKATRDQRFKSVESGEKTFMKLIKELYDEEQRKRIGDEAALIRAATDRKRGELYDYHTYGDNILDIPILNAESVLQKKELEYEEAQVCSEKQEA